MFCTCNKLTSLDLSSFDTSQVTNMDYMFNSCSNLTSLDLSSFDTSQVTNMQYMLAQCSNLTSLDLSSFDTSQVTNMDRMFYFSRSLTSLDLSSFDTSQVTNMYYMFYYCNGLKWLDITGFDLTNISNTSNYPNLPTTSITTLVGNRTIDDVRNNKLYVFNNFNKTINYSSYKSLNVQSFIALLNGLKDLTSSTSLTITLPSSKKSEFTADDLAVATNKNWIIKWA